VRLEGLGVATEANQEANVCLAIVKLGLHGEELIGWISAINEKIMHTCWFWWVRGRGLFPLFHPSSTSMRSQSPSQGIHGISEVLDE
jgi:hypothetical protein